jgi:hypothetical protein
MEIAMSSILALSVLRNIAQRLLYTIDGTRLGTLKIFVLTPAQSFGGVQKVIQSFSVSVRTFRYLDWTVGAMMLFYAVAVVCFELDALARVLYELSSL